MNVPFNIPPNILNLLQTKPIFKSVKTSLKSIIRNPEDVKKLSNTAIVVHHIMGQALMFIKLYLLYKFESHQALPEVTETFARFALKMVCLPSTRAGAGQQPTLENEALKADMEIFYVLHYLPLQVERFAYEHLGQVLNMLSKDIVTAYENNIKQHFMEYVERYVNVGFGMKQEITNINNSNLTPDEKEQHKQRFRLQLRRIKNDILNRDRPMTSENNQAWIEVRRRRLIPQRPLVRDSVYYDIHVHPQDYLWAMIFMMRQVEFAGEKTFNVFPLRPDLVPKHYSIDTAALHDLLLPKVRGLRKDIVELREGEDLRAKQNRIWAMFFHTNKAVFRLGRDYTFHHQIETDGVSCSILFVRIDRAHLLHPDEGKKRGPDDVDIEDKYIDELSEAERLVLMDKRIIAIDPNKGDLIYCVDRDEKQGQIKFRYTQNQRRKETKVKHYRNILNFDKANLLIEGLSIIEHETLLSHFNKKAITFQGFLVYIEHKNLTTQKIAPFYALEFCRKLRFGKYILTQKSEAKMINEFKRRFVITPEDSVICIGDWCEGNHHHRYHESTKGKGFRKLFRRAGFKVFLVNEFRTSCRCSACEVGQCATFRYCLNPRPRTRRNRNYRPIIIRHGLVRCNHCNKLWNRDVNAASNIYKIAWNAIEGLDRPAYLRRP